MHAWSLGISLISQSSGFSSKIAKSASMPDLMLPSESCTPIMRAALIVSSFITSSAEAACEYMLLSDRRFVPHVAITSLDEERIEASSAVSV